MNISYNWLKRYIALTDSAEQVAQILTSIGLEVGKVEKVQTIKGGLEGLVVGEVITCVDHPNSDHLHITTTRVAPDAEPLQIVCGAPNVAAGQKVIVATVGTVLYDGDEKFTIKKGKIRGEESLGMICAEDEIGVGSSHDGIMVLPADTPVGMPAKEYFGVEDDTLIEVDITPNRADGASHYGVARDLYAYYQAHGQNIALSKPSVEAFKVDSNNLPIEVVVENAQACPRYTGVSIKGVTIKESPDWLKKSLSTIGIRPINNVVDVTNFVLHEMGQALHSFDADKIKGNKVVVKNAAEGQKFITLDGVERTMSAADLMICNAEEPMCIAGVFGGLDSGTTEETKNVFLESAYFHPTWIRKTARRHGLQTDASFRYERGTDPNNVIYALKQAAMLIKELAGGTISMDIKDVYPAPVEDFKVELEYSYVNSLIGADIAPETVKSIVSSLEMKITNETATGLSLQVPPYRVDVQRPCDVVEDILRIYGYNNVAIDTTLHSSIITKGAEDKSHKLQNLVSEQLVGCGFNEIMNNSLTAAAYYDGLEAYKSENLVRLMNPLSNDLNVLRQTLLFGGLESLQRNISRKFTDLSFFEFGNSYRFDADKRTEDKILSPYSESYHLALWQTGRNVAASWIEPGRALSVYDLKAHVEHIFDRLGFKPAMRVLSTFADDVFAAGLQVQAANSKKVVAQLGILRKKVTKRFDIDCEVLYADINWTELMKAVKNAKIGYSEISKYPAVKRDLALLIDKSVIFAQIEQVARETEKKLLKGVSLFDVYEGKNLEEGKKSYAVSFILQDDNQTLNDKVIDKTMARLMENFQKRLGAIQR